MVFITQVFITKIYSVIIPVVLILIGIVIAVDFLSLIISKKIPLKKLWRQGFTVCFIIFTVFCVRFLYMKQPDMFMYNDIIDRTVLIINALSTQFVLIIESINIVKSKNIDLKMKSFYLVWSMLVVIVVIYYVIGKYSLLLLNFTH